MKPSISRTKFSHFYHAKDFSLIVVPKSNSNILTFNLAGEYTSVVINRHESANALKKFKKVLAKSQKIN
jgi:hypothetical protein